MAEPPNTRTPGEETCSSAPQLPKGQHNPYDQKWYHQKKDRVGFTRHRRRPRGPTPEDMTQTEGLLLVFH